MRSRLALLLAAASLLAACTTSTPTARNRPTPRPATTSTGSLVAYERWNPDTKTDTVYVVDIRTHVPRPLAATDDHPVWSPDGKWLAMGVPAGRSRRCWACSDLTLISADGSQRRLVAEGGVNAHPSWSPDGRWIAYSHGTNELTDDFAIYLIRPDGTGRHRLSRTLDGVVTWSPTSRQLVVDTASLDGLWLVGADGSGARRLTPPPISGDRTRPNKHERIDSSAAWNPHGDTILFTREAGTGDAPRSGIWIVSAGSGRQRRVSPPSMSASDAAWSPDGRRIAFVGSGIRPSLCTLSAVYVIGADGSGLRRISRFSIDPMVEPTWSPDGHRVAFAAVPPGAACYDNAARSVLDVVTIGDNAVDDIAASQQAWDTDNLAWQP